MRRAWVHSELSWATLELSGDVVVLHVGYIPLHQFEMLFWASVCVCVCTHTLLAQGLVLDSDATLFKHAAGHRMWHSFSITNPSSMTGSLLLLKPLKPPAKSHPAAHVIFHNPLWLSSAFIVIVCCFSLFLFFHFRSTLFPTNKREGKWKIIGFPGFQVVSLMISGMSGQGLQYKNNTRFWEWCVHFSLGICEFKIEPVYFDP